MSHRLHCSFKLPSLQHRNELEIIKESYLDNLRIHQLINCLCDMLPLCTYGVCPQFTSPHHFPLVRVPLSLCLSCVTRKKISRKKWPRAPRISRAGIFFLAVSFASRTTDYAKEGLLVVQRYGANAVTPKNAEISQESKCNNKT